jgi:hypothetical protein
MTNTCSKCGLIRPVEDFALRTNICKPCKRAYEADYYQKNKEKVQALRKVTNERYLERNRQFVLSYLQEHPCIDCGFSDIRALEFDHRDPTLKKVEVSTMISRTSLETLKEEIEKCDVRCANCHRIKTVTQFGTWRSMYVPV